MLIGRSRRAVVLVAAVSLLAARGAASDAAPDTARSDPAPSVAAPPVDEVVREALRVAPIVAARAAGVEAARQMESPAGALPDPVLEVMLQDAGFPDWTVGEEPMSMIGPQVSQGFPFPGKRGARRAAAAAQTLVQRKELDRARRDVALQVRRAYARLYSVDRELELLDASRDLTDLLSVTVTHHVETGDMDQEAALKVRLLTSRLAERRADLEADRAAALAELNRFLDRPGDAPLGIVTSLPDPPAPDAADSLAESASADVAVNTASVTAAEARLHAARLDLRPDFMAGAGVGFRGDLDPVVTLRLGVELPLWQRGKQRPLIRSAEAELVMAREEERDARAIARSEAARLRADWRRAREQVLRYEQSLVPQTMLALDAARSAYLARRTDFSTVLEDFDLWLEARRGLARREADRYSAWAELDALLQSAPEVPADPQGDAR